MRLTGLLAAVALLFAPTALGQTFAPGSLPYDPVKATCDEIIAHTNDNRATKMMSASLYAGGMHMGDNCIPPDYVRAFQLWAEIGSFADMRSVLADLEGRANTGNPLAQSHLRKLEAAGLIEKTRESLSR